LNSEFVKFLRQIFLKNIDRPTLVDLKDLTSWEY
jgi:hypothetical protein